MATDVHARGRTLAHSIRLEYLTIGWNLLEGAVAIAAGVSAGSIALIGFGVDSFIESTSGGILLWRLWAERFGRDAERVEQQALRLVGLSFFLLAGYVAWDAGKNLLAREAPEDSVVGMALAVVSLIVMPWLARAKRRAAVTLASASLRADALQTSICAYLSAILLAGLALNAVLGWWWADPVAALAMVPMMIREGLEAFRGEHCGACG